MRRNGGASARLLLACRSWGGRSYEYTERDAVGLLQLQLRRVESKLQSEERELVVVLKAENEKLVVGRRFSLLSSLCLSSLLSVASASGALQLLQFALLAVVLSSLLFNFSSNSSQHWWCVVVLELCSYSWFELILHNDRSASRSSPRALVLSFVLCVKKGRKGRWDEASWPDTSSTPPSLQDCHEFDHCHATWGSRVFGSSRTRYVVAKSMSSEQAKATFDVLPWTRLCFVLVLC